MTPLTYIAQICRGGCGKLLPMEAFHSSRNTPSGKSRECRDCKKALDRDRIDGRRHYFYQDRSAIPPNCACCGNPFEGRKSYQDHNHITGQIRGWVCARCNVSIGAQEKGVAYTVQATNYLGAWT